MEEEIIKLLRRCTGQELEMIYYLIAEIKRDPEG